MKNQHDAVISETEMYTRSQLMRRLGLTDAAYYALKAKGLPVFTIGKRVYAVGKELIRFFSTLHTNENQR